MILRDIGFCTSVDTVEDELAWSHWKFRLMDKDIEATAERIGAAMAQVMSLE